MDKELSLEARVTALESVLRECIRYDRSVGGRWWPMLQHTIEEVGIFVDPDSPLADAVLVRTVYNDREGLERPSGVESTDEEFERDCERVSERLSTNAWPHLNRIIADRNRWKAEAGRQETAANVNVGHIHELFVECDALKAEVERLNQQVEAACASPAGCAEQTGLAAAEKVCEAAGVVCDEWQRGIPVADTWEAQGILAEALAEWEATR